MSGSPQLFKTDTENAFFSPSGFIYSENDCEIIIPIIWRLGTDGNRLGGGFSGYCVDAVSLPDYLKEYVNSKGGSVPWQLDYIRRTSSDN